MNIHVIQSKVYMNNSRATYNPWAGLSSYQDPETTDIQLKFCGRDNESFDVAQLIDDNIFVTLYGKSGTGKTSLLNAGVFPRLRQEQYLPVSIRLGMDAMDTSFQQCILTKITQALLGKGRQTTVDVVPMPTDEQSTEYLWSYFARTKFTATDGYALFPVLVFDQFEEVFRNRRADAETLLRQIHFMMDENHALSDRIVDDRPYQYDFNFRFVVSIREDDLYRLEDSIDNCYLPDMKRCRYRLRSLTEQGARDAILIPGEGLFKPEEQDSIINTIIGIARNKEDQSISTNVLSLICSRIFVDYQKSKADHISISLVETFIKGNPFERFYNEATHGFSNREKSYIEDHLVDSTGRRNSIPESDFLLHVKDGVKLLEGDCRILQRISTSSDGGSYRVELIHDSFCEPLAGLKEKRERRKRIKWLSFASAIMLLCIGVVGYILYQRLTIQKKDDTIYQYVKELEAKKSELEARNKQLIKEKNAASSASFERGIALAQADSLNDVLTDERDSALSVTQRMLLNQSLALSEKAYTLYGEEDLPTAGQLALAALPKNLKKPDRPYSAEAEQVLRQVSLVPHSVHQINRLRSTNPIFTAAFSSDGEHIVSASDASINILDVKTGKEIKTLKGNGVYYINSVSFSKDGKYIVSASNDTIIRIWDWEKDGEFKDMKGDSHTKKVNSVAFNKDGNRIISASDDKTIKIWDVETGTVIKTLKGHSNHVNSAAFSQDGKLIVSASNDRTVRIWEVGTEKIKKREPLIGHTNKVKYAAFSQDGQRIVSVSENEILIWDTSKGEKLKEIDQIEPGYNSANFSQDGKRIVSTSSSSITIWDAETGKRLQKLDNKSANSAFFSHDDKFVVSTSNGNSIRIWDVETIMKFLILEGHTDQVNTTVYSPDSQRIASASTDSTIIIWDAKTGKQIGKPLEGHTDQVNDAAFSPDGKRIVSASADSSIRIWDAKTGKQIGKPLEGHKDGVNSAAFSNDGKYIVSASDDNTIKIWNVKTGKVINTLQGHSGSVNSAYFNHNGKRIVSASSDNTVRTWNVETGKGIKELKGHTRNVNSAVFNSDGKYIVSAASDCTVRIWEAETGKEVKKMEMNRYVVKYASFSPDSKHIVSGSMDKIIRIWDFPPLQNLIDKTRERFKDRKLTPEERRKYYLE